jgi:hypothetical protein
MGYTIFLGEDEGVILKYFHILDLDTAFRLESLLKQSLLEDLAFQVLAHPIYQTSGIKADELSIAAKDQS